MIDTATRLSPGDISAKTARLWEASADKIAAIDREFDARQGAPVYTVKGLYSVRGWTEWTLGFEVGASILQFDATGDEYFLELGKRKTRELLSPQVTNKGVHDHGFNNVSTYGGLLRLMNEGRIPEDPWERAFYELGVKASGAVQAGRWTKTSDGYGFVHSFNGPHSLFSDTMRSMRALALAHTLGQVLKGENDTSISLLGRLVEHARTTAKYNVYYGKGRDGYDVRGRVCHESLFNPVNGSYRCASTQQGYSPFTTWTRGLAWIMLGFAEQLEFFDALEDAECEPFGGREAIVDLMLEAAQATCDYYIESTPACGVPYWDTGAPGLDRLEGHADRKADPFNPYEPVDSSAAAIATQGMLRLGHYMEDNGLEGADRYWQAGLKVMDTLLDEPYLSTDPHHHGLLLHSVYHWPNRWDYVPDGASIACGESTMWGDYHVREAALYVDRIARRQKYLTFFG